jgi:ubiquinone/menaquinone biosynthesis C-methylase UbiE
MTTIGTAVYYLAVLSAALYLASQVRRPARFIGEPFTWLMNASHSALTDWGLARVKIGRDFTILDVGCGGGKTIGKLAVAAPDGKVYGIDYASGSVAASRRKNADLIKVGRVEVRQASVSRLLFADDTFDLVTAVETQYYWPDPINDMREILRVLRPGGELAVIAESYAGGRFDSLQRPIMKLLRSTVLSPQEHRELFLEAGYLNVQVFEERLKGWICVTGRKPQ